MSPAAQLRQLAVEKELVQQRIALNRARCVIEWQRVRGPLVLVDRAVIQVRRFAPLLKLFAVPVGLAMARRRGATGRSRPGIVAQVLKWAPFALGLARRMADARRERQRIPRNAVP